MTAKEYRSFYYDEMQREPVTDDFALPPGTEMTPELLLKLIKEHEETRVPRYKRLKAAYEGRFLIFGAMRKPDHKPDNRLAADMAKYLLDTFTGYFICEPPTIRHENEACGKWLAEYYRDNDQEDVDAELAEESSKYGHCYEMLYSNEEGLPASTCLTPISTFLVKDDTVLHRPMYGIRYAYDEDGELNGSFSDRNFVTDFYGDGGAVAFNDPKPHAFGDVPIVEYVDNKEKRGLYEGVLNLIEAYNKALSEKANDVDYFADAYMVVEGMELGEGESKNIKANRVVNVWNDDGTPVKVYFLEKPDSDATQENLINRLEMLIFKTAMVPDISDESFGTASGIALKMRLLPMSNLAKKKERKFVASMRRRFKLLANYPTAKPFSGDAWKGVEVVMHRNMPEDILSEAQAAAAMAGIVSEETQLSTLSCVDDPVKEMQRKKDEKEAMAESMTSGFPINRTDPDAQGIIEEEGVQQ